MRISAVSHLTAIQDEPGRLVVCQRACGVSAAAQTLLLIPIVLAVIAPTAMIAAQALAEPATRDRLIASPVNTIGALAGVVIWLTMFGIPALRALSRLGWSRSLEIRGDRVAIHDRSPFGARTSSLPLYEFEGISHHVRTTLSGSRHELVLVHADRSKSLLVGMASTINQQESDDFARRLGLKQLPAGALFRKKSTPAASALNVSDMLKPQAA